MSRAAATLRGPHQPAVPQRKLRAAAPAVLVVTLVLLLPCSSPVPGTTIAGARKWYTVAGLSFQPFRAGQGGADPVGRTRPYASSPPAPGPRCYGKRAHHRVRPGR